MGEKTRWESYDVRGRVRQPVNAVFLYALFAMASNSMAHVKIGISAKVYERMLALRTGIPIPIGVVLFAEVGDRGLAHHLERRLHMAFASRRGAGEWFEFDVSDAGEKALFHGVTRTIYESTVGRTLVWRNITPEQLSVFASLRSKDKR